MKEEDLRQHFLVQLNGHYEGQASIQFVAGYQDRNFYLQSQQGIISFYGRKLSIDLSDPVFPEDDQSVPSDARIAVIYRHTTGKVHVEHTSVDLIVSGNAKKRSLDPGFIVVEEQLNKVECPSEQGVHVLLPLEYAEDIPRLLWCFC
mgnify:CR=1 FL=1